jgi:hypothetical protein
MEGQTRKAWGEEEDSGGSAMEPIDIIQQSKIYGRQSGSTRREETCHGAVLVGVDPTTTTTAAKKAKAKIAIITMIPFPFHSSSSYPTTIADPSSSIGIPHHRLIVIFPMVAGRHHHRQHVPPPASLTVWGVLDVVLAGVDKGCCINGGMDGSSAPVADSLRHRLLQRGKDGGLDLSGGGKRSTGIGRGGGLPSPSSAGRG